MPKFRDNPWDKINKYTRGLRLQIYEWIKVVSSCYVLSYEQLDLCHLLLYCISPHCLFPRNTDYC